MDSQVVEIRDRIERAANTLAREVRLMEICGTHTMSIFRQGLRGLLPQAVRLISGPGCPVCVTSQGYIDAVIELAGRDGVIIATYGDMIRVPGHSGSLEQARAAGARVQAVLSSMDALTLARENPDATVLFVAVGFETTAPATAAAVLAAGAQGLDNFAVLPAHKFVMPAMRALLADGQVRVDGFLCPGHVSVILGSRVYDPIAREHQRPCVVAGFEPMQILQAVALLLEQLVAHQSQVTNVYRSVVTAHGNPHALRLIDEVFTPADAWWRGLGPIPGSGMALRPQFERFDGFARMCVREGADYDPPGCRCGQVVKGLVDPPECPLFAQSCTATTPVGPCMVSSEGTCAAWFKYGRRRLEVAGTRRPQVRTK
ncbi:MAG: Hydrogenase maturation factor HypD [Phycisphaerae bacterium]|nr:Hydrogenase maturation factor HypD [Phycisphaerae bacterium]